MSTQPDWYDVLGVAPDAGKESIRAAWKSMVADLDPTSPSFRVFNQAAEVLLDDERRSAYDRMRDLEDAAADSAPEQVAEARESSQSTEAAGEAAPSAQIPRELPGPGTPTESNLRLLAVTWAAILIAVLGWFVAPQLGEWAADRFDDDKSADAASPQQLMAAQAQEAAVSAVVPVLAYDYRTLEQDKAAATALMTDEFAVQFGQFFAVVEESAPPNKTVVDVIVLESGVGQITENSVDVLLFINRPTQNKARTTPFTYYDQVTLTMQLVDGEWLVGDMRVEPAPS